MAIDISQLPPELQEQLLQLQRLEQQLVAFRYQLEQLTIQKAEVTAALEELKTLDDSFPIQQRVGDLFIPKKLSSVVQELEDRQELLELKASTTKKQEQQSIQQYQTLQNQISTELQNLQSSVSSTGSIHPQS